MDTTKLRRIEIRSSEKEKEEFERAAALMHMGLSEFIRFATHLYVKKVHEEFGNIALSRESWGSFCEALDNPPEPHADLVEGLRWHAENREDDSL